ncbi:MAG: hypothetical protein E7447_01805 [Ruminococcaceae bacterium]|nr:hypothetical protein [Oscillospiraceae bacterium]
MSKAEFGIFRKLKKASKKDEEAFREQMQEEKVGIKDAVAMIIAGFLTIVLPCLLVLLLICGVAFLIFT